MEDKLIPLKVMKGYVGAISNAFDKGNGLDNNQWLDVGFRIVDALEYIEWKEKNT